MMEPVTREVTVVNRRGLHARAAARLVKLAGEFDADITVSKDGAVRGNVRVGKQGDIRNREVVSSDVLRMGKIGVEPLVKAL